MQNEVTMRKTVTFISSSTQGDSTLF